MTIIPTETRDYAGLVGSNNGISFPFTEPPAGVDFTVGALALTISVTHPDGSTGPVWSTPGGIEISELLPGSFIATHRYGPGPTPELPWTIDPYEVTAERRANRPRKWMFNFALTLDGVRIYYPARCKDLYNIAYC